MKKQNDVPVYENIADNAFLRELCDMHGVSGDEERVARRIAAEIEPFCDALYIDPIGNLIAFKKGRETPEKPVMYCAHMDEVGFMIRHICDDGKLLFEAVGIQPEVLPSDRLAIGESRIPGVICAKPVHLMHGKHENPRVEDMYIDIGCQSRAEAEVLGVYASFATFENRYTKFGNETMVRSKALDDRFGCFVLTEILKTDLHYDSYFAFTVGEELGGTGATAATRRIDPGTAFIFESTTASDLPSNTGADRVCAPGDGAVVPFMDGGTLYDRALYEQIRALADTHGIPTQTKTRIAGGTDAASIQRSLSGVRVAAISLPCRYIHTASCVAAVSDMAACVALGIALAKA